MTARRLNLKICGQLREGLALHAFYGHQSPFLSNISSITFNELISNKQKQQQKKNCRFLGPFPFASPLLQSALEKKKNWQKAHHTTVQPPRWKERATQTTRQKETRERKKTKNRSPFYFHQSTVSWRRVAEHVTEHTHTHTRPEPAGWDAQPKQQQGGKGGEGVQNMECCRWGCGGGGRVLFFLFRRWWQGRE